MLLSAATAALSGTAATSSGSSRVTTALPAPRAPLSRASRSIYHSRAQPARRGSSARAAVQAVQETHHATHGTAPITFTLSRKVDFGQHVVLVGDAPELGSWDLASGSAMTWSEGDTWTTTVHLPRGAVVEYKFVLTSPAHAPVWEKCDNRQVSVDPNAISKLSCGWDSDIVVIEAPDRYRSPSPSPSRHAHSFATGINGDYTAHASAAMSNGKVAAAALSAAAAALEQKDRAAAMVAVQEAAAAATAVVAAAEATAAAVAKAVQAAEALVAELDGPGGPGSPGGYKGTNGPAAAAAAHAAAEAKYSAEQLDFMRRKLDAIQAMPAVSRQASPGAYSSNGSAQPAVGARPASPQSSGPAPYPAAATTAFSPDQLAFLQRKSTSPPPAGRTSAPAPAPIPRPRSSSPRPRSVSPPPVAAAPAPIQRPRSSSPRPRSSSPHNASRPGSAAPADTRSYSPEQLEFLRRSGKL